jgi:hypothetical protein
LDRTDLPAAELQEVQNWRRVIVDDISLTANLRSGFWTRLPVVGSYQDDLAFAARRWAADGGKSTYVPALNHGDTGAGEYDGFDCIGSFVSDLMERRAALWSHPLVQRIVKEAPKATADEFSNCQGRPR